MIIIELYKSSIIYSLIDKDNIDKFKELELNRINLNSYLKYMIDRNAYKILDYSLNFNIDASQLIDYSVNKKSDKK